MHLARFGEGVDGELGILLAEGGFVTRPRHGLSHSWENRKHDLNKEN